MTNLADLREAAASKRLIIIAGAGLSIALADKKKPALPWPALIRSGLDFTQSHGLIDNSQRARWDTMCGTGDLDDLLAAAEFLSRKLGADGETLLARWLQDEFSALKADRSAAISQSVSALAAARVPICTLNYDTLIEDITSQPTVAVSDVRSIVSWARREADGILHLHGVWNKPTSCVLSSSDYGRTITDEFQKGLQQALGLLNQIVFVGCGDTLSDPNFKSFITWMNKNVGAAAPRNYILVRSSEEVHIRTSKLLQSFLEPVVYGNDFSELPDALLEISPPKASRRKSIRSVSPEPAIVQRYRDFLVEDCGKMTIEGVRADAETAKQKFDIEKLFVPLSVNQVPPEFPTTDPARDEKLRKWLERNGEAVSFGKALENNPKLALLALPGGGKSLLLKRLAVAYADKSRLSLSSDELPDLDLLPVLIRCREWREQIRLPISSIIDKIGDVTGHGNLNGLFGAIKGSLKRGNVLLLVDGLDEIHDNADRSTFVEHLESFLSSYPKVRLVVTSREAGFALVAPNIMRFCSRWRISPLGADAIAMLCQHWHFLMAGDIPEAKSDAATVYATIWSNPPLRTLAGNPLLLTMLLVVKHGNGRLPPDRVSLYDRAVEVLLDTWNIKGHTALVVREAVPQLSYIAFKLMKQGKQTASERELLQTVEEGRQNVQLIRLYAKDSPIDFLRRVELRSSLLLEGGKVLERDKPTPFYQFRHLTFQEYLAAYAAVEGHYDGYTQGASVLEPLRDVLLSEDWKEVIPMAAVLARKGAQPLLAALLKHALSVEKQFLSSTHSRPEFVWGDNYRLPQAVARITQCLIEEAEFPPEILDDCLRIVATFAHGCRSGENWRGLARGPFGQSLFEKSWELYFAQRLPRTSYIRNSTIIFAANRQLPDRWLSPDGIESLSDDLCCKDDVKRGQALAVICGLLWDKVTATMERLLPLLPLVETCLSSSNPVVLELASWAIALQFAQRKEAFPSPPVSDLTLDRIVTLWMQHPAHDDEAVFSFTLSKALSFPRGSWKPNIDYSQHERLLAAIRPRKGRFAQRPLSDALVLLRYHERLNAVARSEKASIRRLLDMSDKKSLPADIGEIASG